MFRVAFNTSMISRKPTGVGIYSRNLLKSINNNTTTFDYNSFNLKYSSGKFLSLKRILWNFFILPIVARKANFIFSFSSHGTPFAKKQIITIHDLICLNFPSQHKLQYYYFKYVLPIIIRQCTRVVAISEFTKQEIIKFYGLESSKIVVIKNGANFNDTQLSENAYDDVMEIVKGKEYYLCVGASFAHKNTLRLIEALTLVETERKIVILGKDNLYFNEVRMKAVSSGLQNIIFLTYVSDTTLQELYRRSFCNIYISLYEGFGFPPLEAAYFGKISIVSDIPVMREIYGDAVLYVDPNSFHSISKVINDFDRGLVDIHPLKAKFPALLAKYTWENTAIETIKLINQFV